MSEWKEKKLYEVCHKITDGSHYSPVAVNKGYPMLSVKDMREYDFDFSSCKKISNEDFCLMRQNDCIPQVGDVLVAKDGSYLKEIFCCKEYRDIALLSSIAIFRPNQDIILPDFLCYLLKTPFIFNYISKNCVSGSALPRIVLRSFKDVRIPVPDLSTQAEIAGILSSLDSKIKNNRKICANLEAQAQALFKHWFIDFAPFKDGKFVESELGMIPEGWRVGRLGEIADINPSRTIQKGEKATYLDMKNMPTIGSFPLSWEVKEYNGGMKFMNGDTLMARITPCLENGKIAYVNFLQNKEIAFGSTEYIVLSPKNNLFSEYLYFLCRYSSFINYAVKNMNGSSGRQRVSGDTISNYDMIIAPKEIYKEVEPIFKDIMSHIKSLGQESILLSSLRDTLLPKLMSGEIKV